MWVLVILVRQNRWFWDGSSVVGYANYTFGSITAGITLSGSNNVRTTATGANEGGREVEAYGIAMAVNDSLSISYNERMTYKKMVQMRMSSKSTGIALSYTMGGATLAIQNNSQDNSAGTAGSNEGLLKLVIISILILSN